MAFLVLASLAACAPQLRTVKFDGSGNQVIVPVKIDRRKLNFMIDTAVTPSVIDLAAAASLGLPVQLAEGQEAAGTGTQSAKYFPVQMPTVSIGGTGVRNVEAVAFDMSALAKRHGRPVHGILGDSFLTGRIVLVDYAESTVRILTAEKEVEGAIRGCAQVHDQILTFVPGDGAPLLKIRVGEMEIPVSLDTGSALSLELYEGALSSPAISSRIGSQRDRSVLGARGEASVKEAVFDGTVRLGPLEWKQPTVILSGPKGSPGTRLGNLGNGFLKGHRLILDYKNRRLVILGQCRPKSGS